MSSPYFVPFKFIMKLKVGPVSCVLSKFSHQHELPQKWGKQNKSLRTLKEDVNNKANTEVGRDEQTWRRLKQTEIVRFWKLVSPTIFF